MSHVGLSEHDSVSSQCARGKSPIARKPEFHPNNLMVFFFFFFFFFFLRNVTIQILNLILLS